MNKEFHDIIFKSDRIHLMRKIMLDRAGEDIKIYFGQLPILEFIIDNEGCNQKDICNFVKVSPASMALSTKRLAKAGLITKVADKENLRCNKLFSTEKGRELSALTRKKFDEFEETLFKGFSAEEIEFLGEALDKMINNVSEREKLPNNFFTLAEMANTTKG